MGCRKGEQVEVVGVRGEWRGVDKISDRIEEKGVLKREGRFERLHLY